MPASTAPCPATAPSRQEKVGAVRATVSFLVFGSIGALVGKWISSFNYHDGHRLLKPVGMVVGGLLGGTVAAYSALKVSERGELDSEIPAGSGVMPTTATPTPHIQAESIHRAAENVLKEAPNALQK